MQRLQAEIASILAERKRARVREDYVLMKGYDTFALRRALERDLAVTEQYLRAATDEELALCVENASMLTLKSRTSTFIDLFRSIARLRPAVVALCEEDYFAILDGASLILAD